jgi:hypothetical protein
MAEQELDRLTLLATYRPVATCSDSPLEFYKKIRGEGVSKITAYVLLREFYGMSLSECAAVDAQAGSSGS